MPRNALFSVCALILAAAAALPAAAQPEGDVAGQGPPEVVRPLVPLSPDRLESRGRPLGSVAASAAVPVVAEAVEVVTSAKSGGGVSMPSSAGVGNLSAWGVADECSVWSRSTVGDGWHTSAASRWVGSGEGPTLKSSRDSIA